MRILLLCCLLLLAFCGALRRDAGYDRGLILRSTSCISSSSTSLNLTLKKATATVAIASTFFGSTVLTSFPSTVSAKDPLPTLDKIFAAVRKEISPEGESIARLKKDINTDNWEDVLTYTREYDAGFRGGVLKAAWKQLGDRKGQGIEVSNSFTFDLIALNKAARNQNKEDALLRLDDVRNDLVKFEKLDPEKYK